MQKAPIGWSAAVSRVMNFHIFLPYLKLLLPSRQLLWLRYETLHLTLHEYSRVVKLYANIWMKYVMCLCLSNVGRRIFFCCIVYLETKAVIGQKNLSYEYIKYKISKLKNNMKILNKELLNLVLKT